MRAAFDKSTSLAVRVLSFADMPSVQEEEEVAFFPRMWGEEFLQVGFYFVGVGILA